MRDICLMKKEEKKGRTEKQHKVYCRFSCFESTEFSHYFLDVGVDMAVSARQSSASLLGRLDPCHEDSSGFRCKLTSSTRNNRTQRDLICKFSL